MNGHTEPDFLPQQPVADMRRKSTRAEQAWRYYTSIFLCFSGTFWATEDVFAFRKPSWAFICLIISEPKHTLGIRITVWQRVPQNCHLSCTFPACDLITWGSPNPCIMRKCGYLFLSHLFHATQDFSLLSRPLHNHVFPSVNQLAFVQKSFHISEYPCHFSLYL